MMCYYLFYGVIEHVFYHLWYYTLYWDVMFTDMSITTFFSLCVLLLLEH